MKIFTEFRDFIARGNVIDLAVGVIIGAAFGKIVTSMVDQVIMPPIGILTAGVDFSQMKLVLKAADPVAKQAEVAILYGAFINTLIQFVIIAWVVFLLVKAANAVRRKYESQQAAEASEAVEPAAPTPTEALLAEIRDLLKADLPPPPKPPKPVGKTVVRRG
jgi:large conductance mechanosensitive channel